MVKEEAMPQINESLYDGHFTMWDILRHGGPIDLVVLILSLSLLLILVTRRGMRTRPEQSLLTIADLFMLTILIALPVLLGFSQLPIQYLAAQRGGVDSDLPLMIGLNRAHLHATFALFSVTLILLATMVQCVVRGIRRRSEKVG